MGDRYIYIHIYIYIYMYVCIYTWNTYIPCGVEAGFEWVCVCAPGFHFCPAAYRGGSPQGIQRGRIWPFVIDIPASPPEKLKLSAIKHIININPYLMNQPSVTY